MPFNSLAFTSGRREDRDEVHHRTRAGAPDAGDLTVLIVNISPHGLMARCDTPVAVGSRLTFTLPGTRPLTAEVRWALGGRIGCEFAQQIPPVTYYALLPKLMR